AASRSIKPSTITWASRSTSGSTVATGWSGSILGGPPRRAMLESAPRAVVAVGRWMASVGLGPAGQGQLLGQGRAHRPQHQIAALAPGPFRHPGQDLDPGRIDQDHAPQVEHDVVVALTDQVAQVLPELTGGLGVDVAAHSDNGIARRGSGGGLQQWAHDGLLPWEAAGQTIGQSPRVPRQEIAPAGAGLLCGDRPHVGRLGALLALGDVELDGLAVLERATVLDGAGVDEDVVAGLGLDEAVALVGVEPLHGSNSHAGCPSLRCLGGIDPAGAGGAGGRGTSSTVNNQVNREPVLRRG